MKSKKSKILLRIMVTIGLFSCAKTFCMNEFQSYYHNIYQSLDADKVFLGCGVVAVGIGMQNSYYTGKQISSNPVAIGSIMVVQSTLIASLIKGLYNLRKHQVMLQEIEARYGFSHHNAWSQLPGYYATQLICFGSQETTEAISSCMQTIKLKTEKMDNAVIFDFAQFINVFPHIAVGQSYCTAKHYFSAFGCVTLSDLKNIIRDLKVTLEQDFQKLKSLTDLPYAYKMPLTLQDFNNFVLFLNQGKQYVVVNTLLGAFGYSSLHNCDRVKNYITQIVKYYTYASHLEEMLLTCSDDIDTQLNTQGNLNFTLQHIDHTVAIK